MGEFPVYGNPTPTNFRLTTYDLTVPIMIRSLQRLLGCLKKGEQWAKDNNRSIEEMLHARIYQGAKPLAFYIIGASNTAGNLLSRIGGESQIYLIDDLLHKSTLKELYDRLEFQILRLHSANKSLFMGPNDKCKVTLRGHQANFRVLTYIQNYALPDYFFHQNSAYCLFRMQGVPLTKMDILGAEEDHA
ncbi:uncharacterized protein SEPMUDRAFT_45061 [Sphaerulina musiva SO2202]|uniref:Uncharacterized protein n=1 Tax=Sphaerulina musiva (strain SO2202) TaxID=692275 RepID=M3D3W3_SPHMS|nr:uncharacterized protein SEPMUDRAFT_45061 [Sphaerulina musiva SO2202]EMF12890.1 hypothetical protein SEPMUDRAFT_45061 [Sphaerulina musiva SO2202]